MIVSRWMEICKSKYTQSSPLINEFQHRILTDSFTGYDNQDV